MQVRRFRPRTFQEVEGILDTLRSGQPVEVDLSYDPRLARRILDAMIGGTYALGGVMTRSGPKLYRAGMSTAQLTESSRFGRTATPPLP